MKVTFATKYSAFCVRAPKGTLISLNSEPEELADGVYIVGDDGYIAIDEGWNSDKIYLNTEGDDYTASVNSCVCYPLGDDTVEVRAGISVLPFKKKSKGGDGKGYPMICDNITYDALYYYNDVRIGEIENEQ